MDDKDYTPEIISIYDDVTTPSRPSDWDNTSRTTTYEPERPAPETVAEEKTTSASSATNKTEEKVSAKKTRKRRSLRINFSFLSDRRWKIALGVVFILAATYLFISALSYFVNAPKDLSELDNTTVSQLVETTGPELENAGGPAGALWSHRLFTYGLGLGVVPVLIWLVLVGIALLDIRKCNFWSMTFKALLLAVTLSLVLGLVFFNSGHTVPLGGYHGHYINRLLIERVSWIGAICVSLALVGCVVGVYFYDLSQMVGRYRAKWNERRARRRAEEEERRRAMQAAEEELTGAFRDEPLDEGEKAGEEGSLLVYNPMADGFATSDENRYDEKQVDLGEEEPEEVTVSEAPREKEGDTEPSRPAAKTAGKESQPKTEENQEGAEAELTIKESEAIEKGSSKEIHNDPTAELPRYKMPKVDLLEDRPVKTDNVDITEIEDKKNQIIEALSKYGIGISKIEATVGPTVTMYEIVPAEGVKIATIKRLEEDIAMALAALSTRIIAPIPGKSAIGIEVPNRDPQSVAVRTIFGSKDFQESEYELPIALGVTIDNKVCIADLAKMPHLLVAGATGKGKSVGMNVIINSLLYKKHPSELKLVLIDPKMVEFYPYRKLLNHYLAQVPDAENAIITDTSKVVETLNSLCVEMDDRYRLLQQAEVVKITHYNDLFINGHLNPEEGHKFLPYIVVIVDEYADLLMTAGKEIETPIARLAQKARAVGIHVIIATQRPSSNIITGVIKGNFPARIAFKVTSYVDSNIILGNSGAFQLIGKGDMLLSQDGELKRVQCAFISTDEIKRVAAHIAGQKGFSGPFELPEPPIAADNKGSTGGGGDLGNEDPLLEEVARAVVISGQASTSNVQRNYAIGYNRAGRIMDQLHALGVVGPAQGSKPRDILVDQYRLEEILQARHGD